MATVTQELAGASGLGRTFGVSRKKAKLNYLKGGMNPQKGYKTRYNAIPKGVFSMKNYFEDPHNKVKVQDPNKPVPCLR